MGESRVSWSTVSKQTIQTIVKWGDQGVQRKEEKEMEVGVHKWEDPRKLPYHSSFVFDIAETSLESKIRVPSSRSNRGVWSLREWKGGHGWRMNLPLSASGL